VNLKCDPELALELRARYALVHPGYHRTNATGTPSTSTGRSNDGELREMIEHSYELVVNRLPRAERARLQG